MRTLLSLVLLFILSGCIGDDIIDDRVPETLRFTSCVDTLAQGSTFVLEAVHFDNLGKPTDRTITWSSSDNAVIDVDENGVINGLMEGNAVISAFSLSDGIDLSASKKIIVAQNTSVSETREGTIRTTSSYQLEGSFTAQQMEEDLLLQFHDDFKASTALPGLYLYLTNNPSTSSGALEVKAVDVFSGAHKIIVPDVDISTYRYLLYYCKPFSVKVGDGEML